VKKTRRNRREKYRSRKIEGKTNEKDDVKISKSSLLERGSDETGEEVVT
jgi:hypothetical protein